MKPESELACSSSCSRAQPRGAMLPSGSGTHAGGSGSSRTGKAAAAASVRQLGAHERLVGARDAAVAPTRTAASMEFSGTREDEPKPPAWVPLPLGSIAPRR